MVVIKSLPEQTIIDGFKGKIDFYVHRGIPCVRRWPRSPGHQRAPAVEAQWSIFTAAVQGWNTLPEDIQSAYRRWASPSSLSGRDLFIKGYISGIYGYPKENVCMPSCHAFRSTAWDNLVSGTWYDIPYNAVVYDYGGNFDVVNNRFVCPRTARYSVYAQLLINGLAAVSYRYLYINVNGVPKSASAQPNVNTSWQLIQASALLDCSKGDFITAKFMQISGIDTPDCIVGHPWLFMMVCLQESTP